MPACTGMTIHSSPQVEGFQPSPKATLNAEMLGFTCLLEAIFALRDSDGKPSMHIEQSRWLVVDRISNEKRSGHSTVAGTQLRTSVLTFLK
jgi:hypothetical protein